MGIFDWFNREKREEKRKLKLAEKYGFANYEDYLKAQNKQKNKPTKAEVVEQYKIKDDMPESMETNVEGHKLLKRDMSGLLAYFKEMPNMERIYNEFTHSIRNGYTVEKYLNNTNFIDDNEIRDIVRKGFGVIAGFLEDMLKIKENTELRKDFNACKEVIKILQAKNDDKTESNKSQNISADDYFKQSLDYFNLGVANDPLTSEGASEMKKGIKSLDKAIKLDEKNPKYFYNRGTGKKMILDYKSAIPDFTKAIKLKFESPEMAYFNRAMSKLHTKDLEGSKKDNKKALELGYDEYQVEQLDDWIDSVTEMGYDEFMNQFD